MNRNELNIPSDSVQEILGKMPNWLIRWGITLVFVVIVGLLIGAWFIRYPDILSARVTLVTPNPPVRVVARSDGEIRFLVPSDATAKTGDELAIIESAADVDDVLALREQLPGLERFVNTLQWEDSITLDPNPELGSIQVYYSTFLQRYEDFRFFERNPYFRNRIQTLQRQLDTHRSGREDIIRQKNFARREMDLAKNKFDTDEELFRRAVISQRDFEISETAYLQARRAVESLNSQISAHDSQANSYRESLLDLEQQEEQQRISHQTGMRDSFRQLQNQVQEWEIQFILTAPSSGKVSRTRFSTDNQYVRAGESVLTIVPETGSETAILGRAYLPSANAGKVQIGQTARIKLDSFAPHEFGVVKGSVTSISPVPQQDERTGQMSYLVEIRLPNPLVSSHNQVLPFRQELGGSAEIVTEELRLLQRVFYQLRALFTDRG